MPGVIIPDDWDGITFQCQRIEWPASIQWQAILLGQTTEPTRENFWDPESGDVDEAAAAAQAAYRQTVPTIYTTGCDDMIPTIPVVAFKVTSGAAFELDATTWTFIPFEETIYQHNSPEFNLVTGRHEIDNEDHLGLWHYDLSLAVTPAATTFMQALKYAGATSIVLTGESNAYSVLSWDYVWSVTGDKMGIEMWSSVATELDFAEKNCQWSGHFVGPVVTP